MLKSDSSNCFLSPVSPPAERWIALVNKGGCKLAFVLSAAILKNASAIVIYSQDEMLEVHGRRLKRKQLRWIFNNNESSAYFVALFVIELLMK